MDKSRFIESIRCASLISVNKEKPVEVVDAYVDCENENRCIVEVVDSDKAIDFAIDFTELDHLDITENDKDFTFRYLGIDKNGKELFDISLDYKLTT